MAKTTSRDSNIPVFTQNYLMVIAWITFLLGVCLVIAPSLISNLFFEVQYPASTFFVRMLGSTLLGYGTLNFLAIHDGSYQAYRIAVLANLATLVVASCISLVYIQMFTGYAWLVIGQHLLFTGGFALCLWQLTTPEKAPAPKQIVNEVSEAQ